MGKIKALIRKKVLNRYKLTRLRHTKRWLITQNNRIKHWYNVKLDAYLMAKYREHNELPEIKGIEETLETIVQNKCSIARFGDGEIGLIFGKGIGFQKNDKELGERLASVLRSDVSDHMLIGISEWIFNSNFGTYPEYRLKYLKSILNLLLPGKTYYSADISRFYKTTPDGHDGLNQICLLKEIWDGRSVILVEGEKSRMGVGNDLLDNAKSIRRILCPAENAFSHYEEIYTTTLDKASKDDLILIALGPTATVLAYDLFLAGYQAVDIGHADISYEWFLRDVSDPSGRVVIAGKYVNEVGGGNQVEDINDADYEGQIIAVITDE
ncbi:MAG: GT-D fold domain-containing glycosyltransferase [Erysipelotrichaceae bacterium]|nr:GT-D fold domain-containing glycosyltransferase [Erysipelotrichaceae bacterium]